MTVHVDWQCRERLFQCLRGRLRAMPNERITADPAIMAGAPTIRGTRVTVSAVLGQLASGSTIEELLEDVLAALAVAAESLPHERPFVAA